MAAQSQTQTHTVLHMHSHSSTTALYARPPKLAPTRALTQARAVAKHTKRFRDRNKATTPKQEPAQRNLRQTFFFRNECPKTRQPMSGGLPFLPALPRPARAASAQPSWDTRALREPVANLLRAWLAAGEPVSRTAAACCAVTTRSWLAAGLRSPLADYCRTPRSPGGKRRNWTPPRCCPKLCHKRRKRRMR
jgi:hypothetical protein